jgi:hypothetical protein
MFATVPGIALGRGMLVTLAAGFALWAGVAGRAIYLVYFNAAMTVPQCQPINDAKLTYRETCQQSALGYFQAQSDLR